MHAMLYTFLILLTALFGLSPASAHAQDYGYPLSNPFEATIGGTPSALQLPALNRQSIREKTYSLRIRPERELSLPSNFWPVKRLEYQLARQAQAAPLMFIIAGTGSRYDSGSMDYLKKLYYSAGFHVVQLSSPTSYDFMVAASRYATPGYSPLDAQELYHVMTLIRQRHTDLKVTDWNLMGYSLGGLQAAFVSHLDEEQQRFNFKRVLLLNPPVNLYTSVNNLDLLATVVLPEVHVGHTFYQSLFDHLARFFEQKGHFDLNEAILLEFQQSKERLNDEQLAMLIGSMFRLFAADISFTSDLINRRGLITPKTQFIHDGTSLTPFLELALMCDFNCYMEQQLLPFWQQHYGGSDLKQLIHDTSLYALTDYLHSSPKIAVMHNQDDIILGPGDLSYLRNTFADRLWLYPTGGHLGNMAFEQNAADMLDFFHD